jgi:outer membrane biogenesis lipoprotein LolB
VSGPAPSRRRRRAALLIALLVTTTACGSRKIPALPSAGGSPFPDAAAAYTDATAQCRTIRTLSAELGLSGRAGGQKLRGHLLAGFATPGKVRLEAPAPFGRPIFTLAMHDDAATLVLNREGRVLRDAKPAELIEALTGVALNPDELRAAVSGCGFGVEHVDGGQSYPGDWVSAESGPGRLWLRRINGAWRLVAAARDNLEVRYDEFASGRPAAVRLTATGSNANDTDLTLRLSQLEINIPLDAAVFEVEVPPDATPLTLDELRRSGPLGGPGSEHDLPPL